MSEQYFLERIIKDAKAEARKIVNEAKQRTASNIDFARKQASENEAEAAEAARTLIKTETESTEAAQTIERQIEVLTKKTEIVDRLFLDVKTELYNALNTKLISTLTKKYSRPGDTIKKENYGIVIDNADYQIRLTIDELIAQLRRETETEVVRMLFT